MSSQTLKKAERLSSKKVIDRLFAKGSPETSSVFSYPLRVLYFRDSDSSSPLPAILISVPKRHFKRAVDRNLVKRRIREAYRLHKKSLLTEPSTTPPTSVAFLYVAKEILSFEDIEKKMKFVLRQVK